MTGDDFEDRLNATSSIDEARDLFGAASRELGYQWFDAISMTASLLATPRRAGRFFVSNYWGGDAWGYLPGSWPGDDEVTARASRSSQPMDLLKALEASEKTPSTLFQLGLVKMFRVKRAWLFPLNTLGRLRMVTCYITEQSEDGQTHFQRTRDPLHALAASFMDRIDHLHSEASPETRRTWDVQKFPASLTEEELACFQLLVRGMTNPEIAKELDVAVDTVKYHLKKVFKKLDLSSRAEAIAFAIDNGIG